MAEKTDAKLVHMLLIPNKDNTVDEYEYIRYFLTFRCLNSSWLTTVRSKILYLLLFAETIL